MQVSLTILLFITSRAAGNSLFGAGDPTPHHPSAGRQPNAKKTYPYRISVNGERAKTQKVTFAKEKGDYDNATVKLLVKNSKAPGMVDMELTNREGKGLLRAEIVRTSQSQIRIRGAYDCNKVR
jgi:hypothetical protein